MQRAPAPVSTMTMDSLPVPERRIGTSVPQDIHGRRGQCDPPYNTGGKGCSRMRVRVSACVAGSSGIGASLYAYLLATCQTHKHRLLSPQNCRRVNIRPCGAVRAEVRLATPWLDDVAVRQPQWPEFV